MVFLSLLALTEYYICNCTAKFDRILLPAHSIKPFSTKDTLLLSTFSSLSKNR